MRAASVKIHNFRSIRDAKLALGTYAVVVGQNNSGKSNLLEALQTFWDERAFVNERDVPRFPKEDVDDGESWIEVEFILTDDEYATLKEEYRLGENRLLVRNWKRRSEGKTSAFGYEKATDGQISISVNEFYGWASVKKLGTIIFIPALSKLDDHLKTTGTSSLGEMVKPILASMFANEEDSELKAAREALDLAIGNLGTHAQTTTAALAKKINDELTDWGLTFKIGTAKSDPMKLLSDSMIHQITDPSVPGDQSPSHFGQGFQRHLIFTLLKLKAKVGSEGKVHTKAKAPAKAKTQSKSEDEGAKREFCPRMTLVLFEEPEVFLHPEQIDSLHRVLRDISLQPSSQVVVTTHSPRLASGKISDLTSFARVVRASGKSTIYQIEEVALSDLLDANSAEINRWQNDPSFPRDKAKGISPDDITAEMEAVKYALYLNPIRCEAFFARRVLLVEGATETALLTWMADNGHLGDDLNDVVFMDALGKFSIHRFMGIFSALGISHAVLYDGDNGKYKNTVDLTIQQSRTSFTLNIDSFVGELEDFLGIAKAGTPHRKPQHVMYLLGQSLIPDSKLIDLAEKIKGLFTVPTSVAPGGSGPASNSPATSP